MSDQTLTCPECGNTSPPQPLDGPGVVITCQYRHLHTPKRPIVLNAPKEETK
jgi:hypothetical protein